MVTTVQQNRLIRELKTTHHILSNFKVVNSWQLAMPCYALFLLIPSHCRNIDMNSKWISWPNQILPSESEPTKPKFWHPRGNNVAIFGCIEQKNKQDVAHFDIVWHIDVLACCTRCRNLHDILIGHLANETELRTLFWLLWKKHWKTARSHHPVTHSLGPHSGMIMLHYTHHLGSAKWFTSPQHAYLHAPEQDICLANIENHHAGAHFALLKNQTLRVWYLSFQQKSHTLQTLRRHSRKDRVL